MCGQPETIFVTVNNSVDQTQIDLKKKKNVKDYQFLEMLWHFCFYSFRMGKVCLNMNGVCSLKELLSTEWLNNLFPQSRSRE